MLQFENCHNGNRLNFWILYYIVLNVRFGYEKKSLNASNSWTPISLHVAGILRLPD